MFGFGPTLGFRTNGKADFTGTVTNPDGTKYDQVYNGKLNIGNEKGDPNTNPPTLPDDVKPFIFGYGAQVGAEFGGRFQVTAEWTGDLNDANPSPDYKQTTGMFNLRLGLLLNSNAY